MTIERLTEQQRQLVADNEGLIWGYLGKYGIYGDNDGIEDMYGICALALCRAAQLYDKKKFDCTFSTYAYAAMKYECRKFYRLNHNKFQNTAFHFEDFNGSANGKYIYSGDRDDDYFIDAATQEQYQRSLDETVALKVIRDNAVHKFISKFRGDKKRAEAIVFGVLDCGYSQSEVAKKLGVKRQIVNVIWNSFRKVLQKEAGVV